MLAHLPEATDVFKWHVQECVLQILQRDCAQVQRLVEDAVRQLSAPAAASSATPLDNCQLMEAMNDNHIAQLLPRLKACDEGVTAFCQRCMDSKVASIFAWKAVSPLYLRCSG